MTQKRLTSEQKAANSILFVMEDIIRESRIKPPSLPYHIGFKILINVREYLLGLNPAPAGRLSWTMTFYQKYEERIEEEKENEDAIRIS
jgi:hypothetical protein